MMAPEPDKKLIYPIPQDDTGGTLFVFGKSDAPRVVIMCAGWPDDQSSFSPLAQRLASESGCLVGVACLAGFDNTSTAHKKEEGYTFQEWVTCLREAIKVLRAESSNPSAKLIGIFHDWGSLAGTMYTNQVLRDDEHCRELILDRVVFCDVLIPPKNPTIAMKQTASPGASQSSWTIVYTVLVMVAYQYSLAVCFLLQRFVSKWLAGLVFMVGNAVSQCLRLIPVGTMDVQYVRETANGNVYRFLYMAYPYLYLHKTYVTGQVQRNLDGAHLPIEQLPILYMYGIDKPIQFHTATSLNILQNDERCKVVGVKEAGHWFYLQQPEVSFREIDKFIQQV